MSQTLTNIYNFTFTEPVLLSNGVNYLIVIQHTKPVLPSNSINYLPWNVWLICDIRVQPKLDTSPSQMLRKSERRMLASASQLQLLMLLRIAKIDLPCFPSFNFQFTRSHEHCSPTQLRGALGFTMAWLYIKLIREVGSNKPTGDAVDSESELARSNPTVLS